MVEHTEDVIEELIEDDDVRLVLANSSDPQEKFGEMVCHWLVVFWLDRPRRELYSFEVESQISDCATDALQLQVLDCYE